MNYSREKLKRFALIVLAVLLGGCTGFDFEIVEKRPPPPAQQAEKAPPKTGGGTERVAELKQEISKLHQEEQWTQDQINQTTLELQGPKLLGKSSRDTVDLEDVGRTSADMTAQYEYKNRIKKQRIDLESELSQLEQQSLGGGGGGGSH